VSVEAEVVTGGVVALHCVNVEAPVTIPRFCAVQAKLAFPVSVLPAAFVEVFKNDIGVGYVVNVEADFFVIAVTAPTPLLPGAGVPYIKAAAAGVSATA